MVTADTQAATSVYPEPCMLSAAVEVLEHVEGLPIGSTGVLGFDDDGVILVDGGRICWALARDMRERLTDIICQDTTPVLPRSLIEDVFRQCKQNGTPMGETLVASGLVSEVGLRTALARHNAEGIARLARARTRPTRFSSHAGGTYDPRFSFSTTELLAAVAVRRDHVERAAMAKAHLAEVEVQDAVVFAFVRDMAGASPALIAVDRRCPLRVGETLEICGWVNGLFDVTVMFDAKTALISATWCSSTAVVAWRFRDVSFAALCSSRPASALLVNQLAFLLEVGKVRYSGTMRVRS